MGYSSIWKILLASISRSIDPETKNVLEFILNLNKIGQYELALFTCENYKLYNLARELILSQISKISNSFSGNQVADLIAANTY